MTITDPAWRKRIGRTQITFGPCVNVLAGPNGSGKSSLMEAIMASGDKGARSRGRGEKPPCRVRALCQFRITHSDLVKNGPHRGYFDESMDMMFQVQAMGSGRGRSCGR